MRKVKLYIAMSLDGKIAHSDGGVDWLESIPNPDQLEYGYSDFYSSIGVTIQGYQTYQQVIGWGIDFPYADKENYVFTRKQGMEPTEHVKFISKDHVEFVNELKLRPGKDIWLVGGGQLNSLFLDHDLIDEIEVFVMPILLTQGIDLFAELTVGRPLNLMGSKAYPNGVVQLNYAVQKSNTNAAGQ